MNTPKSIEKLEEIKELVGEDKLKTAIEELEKLGKALNLDVLSNEAIQLSRRLSNVERDIDRRTESSANIGIEENRITESVLNLINRVEDGSLINEPVPPTPQPPPPPPQPQPSQPPQSISTILDYIFIGLIVILFLTCIGGLVFTFISESGSLPSGLISMSGIFGCFFSMDSWRSKLRSRTVFQTTPA